MTKNKKIIFSIIAILLFIYLFFSLLPISGVEKSIIKTKIAKATREPIIGKRPSDNFLKEAFHNKRLDIIDDKNLTHYITDKNITKLKKQNSNVIAFEPIYEVTSEDVKRVAKVYYDFIEETNDAKYFKPELDTLLIKKVGDKITLIIDNEEFTGYITNAKKSYYLESEDSTVLIEDKDLNKYDKKNLLMEYDFDIQPEKNCNSTNCEDVISIYGYRSNKGYSMFNGTIEYTETNGGMPYEFEGDENLAVMVHYWNYDDFTQKQFRESGMIIDNMK